MENSWIYLPEGGYPKSKTKVNVLVLSRSRDPYYDKGKPGRAYATTAYFTLANDGTRNWYDVIMDDDMSCAFFNEYDFCEDYEELESEHPDHSWDSYIVAWQPMPSAPENIVWPDRKPLKKWKKASKCPACHYTPSKDANLDEARFCPRCGSIMRKEYSVNPAS